MLRDSLLRLLLDAGEELGAGRNVMDQAHDGTGGPVEGGS